MKTESRLKNTTNEKNPYTRRREPDYAQQNFQTFELYKDAYNNILHFKELSEARRFVAFLKEEREWELEAWVDKARYTIMSLVDSKGMSLVARVNTTNLPEPVFSNSYGAQGDAQQNLVAYGAQDVFLIKLENQTYYEWKSNLKKFNDGPVSLRFINTGRDLLEAGIQINVGLQVDRPDQELKVVEKKEAIESGGADVNGDGKIDLAEVKALFEGWWDNDPFLDLRKAALQLDNAPVKGVEYLPSTNGYTSITLNAPKLKVAVKESKDKTRWFIDVTIQPSILGSKYYSSINEHFYSRLDHEFEQLCEEFGVGVEGVRGPVTRVRPWPWRRISLIDYEYGKEIIGRLDIENLTPLGKNRYRIYAKKQSEQRVDLVIPGAYGNCCMTVERRNYLNNEIPKPELPFRQCHLVYNLSKDIQNDRIQFKKKEDAAGFIEKYGFTNGDVVNLVDSTGLLSNFFKLSVVPEGGDDSANFSIYFEKLESQPDFVWKRFYNPLKEEDKMYISWVPSSYSGEDSAIQMKILLNRQQSIPEVPEILADKNHDGTINPEEAKEVVETLNKITQNGEPVTLSDIVEQVGAAPIGQYRYSNSKKPYRIETFVATGVKVIINKKSESLCYLDIYHGKQKLARGYESDTHKVNETVLLEDALTPIYDSSPAPDSSSPKLSLTVMDPGTGGEVLIDNVEIINMKRRAVSTRVQLGAEANLNGLESKRYFSTVLTLKKKMQKTPQPS